jgi:hypothetical protein
MEKYETRIAVDASLATQGGSYPLILFVHGGYGSGYNSAFISEYLVSHGYIYSSSSRLYGYKVT